MTQHRSHITFFCLIDGYTVLEAGRCGVGGRQTGIQNCSGPETVSKSDWRAKHDLHATMVRLMGLTTNRSTIAMPVRRKQPSYGVFHDKKPRARLRCEGHRNVLQTPRISGEIYRTASTAPRN